MHRARVEKGLGGGWSHATAAKYGSRQRICVRVAQFESGRSLVDLVEVACKTAETVERSGKAQRDVKEAEQISIDHVGRPACKHAEGLDSVDVDMA